MWRYQLLEDLGLDPDAEAVYRTMLLRRELGVAGIASVLQLTESHVRDALNRLADLTLLRPSFDTPGQLRPVSPEVGLQLLLQRQRAQVVELQHRLNQSQAAVSELITEYRAVGRPGLAGHTELLDGVDAVHSRLEELVQKATSECLSFMPGGGQSAQSLAASKPLDELMLRRGTTVLTVYLDSVRNDSATLAYAQWLAASGGAVRATPTLPLRMVLFDRQVALVPLDPEHTRRGALQLTGSGIITALTTLFDQVWKGAVPIGEELPHNENEELTNQERALLSLLAQGLTDEVAARRLGISLRTTRRMMAGIMERLGAHSRFQAGMQLSERRWLPP